MKMILSIYYQKFYMNNKYTNKLKIIINFYVEGDSEEELITFLIVNSKSQKKSQKKINVINLKGLGSLSEVKKLNSKIIKEYESKPKK